MSQDVDGTGTSLPQIIKPQNTKNLGYLSKKVQIIQLSMIAHARQDRSENKRGYISVGIECK